ncbi:MAG: glycosyltransferase family 9 protein [Geobacter sp.]|nr:glycosyltransferase family 9 protein [Geobacter sp.]
MNIPPRNILVVNIRLIGDVILTTPLIAILKAAWPDTQIDLLVNRGTGEFLGKDPRVRHVLSSDGSRSGGYLKKIFRRYDLAINMNASDRGNIAVLLASRHLRVGLYYGNRFWKDIWKKLLFSHPVSYPFPIHYARLCQVVAEKLGLAVTKLESKVFWDTADENIVAELLALKGVQGPYMVVHPFARWRYKYWQVERFAAVSDSVAERYGLQPVWTSSPVVEEQEALTMMSELCRIRPVQIPGELNLNQITCLLAHSSLYLGLDTAVSHLAATTGIPVVALYGPTITDWWSPWNNNGPIAQQCPLPRGKQRTGSITVLQAELPCVPCGRAGCDDNGGDAPCMQAIEVDEVLAAVDELLAEKGEA